MHLRISVPVQSPGCWIGEKKATSAKFANSSTYFTVDARKKKNPLKQLNEDLNLRFFILFYINEPT